jgi:hypothetical protein
MLFLLATSVAAGEMHLRRAHPVTSTLYAAADKGAHGLQPQALSQ